MSFPRYFLGIWEKIQKERELMNDVLWIVIKCAGMILLGILAGNGAVYFFNKAPGKWFCDYNEEPSEELLHPTEQRVKSYPWKYIFSMLFIIPGIKMVMEDWQFAVAGIFAMWLLLEMCIADVKYRIVPDQYVILLAVTAFGFIPFHFDYIAMLLGAVTGFAVMGITGLLGKLISKKETLGGGDVKLFTALGLITGVEGILFIFAATALLSGGHFTYLLARKKIKVNDSMPMVPYIAIGAALYLVFFWGKFRVLQL